MVERFKINKEKAINSILFVLEKLGGEGDFHKVFKILYFADQKHLANYGLPITGDFYIAMKDGPVPSELYDIFKSLRGDSFFSNPEFQEFFEVRSRYFIKAIQKPDTEELAESNIECLLESVEENRHLNFTALKNKSHQKAWDNAQNDEMSIYDIAEEGGASPEMLKYIQLNVENHQAFSHYAKLG